MVLFFVVWVAVVGAAAFLARRAWRRRRRPLGLITRCPRCGGQIRTDVRICSHCFQRVPQSRGVPHDGELQANRPDE